MEAKWQEIDELMDYIHRNLDICCQDLCDGQGSKQRLERVRELLSEIRFKE